MRGWVDDKCYATRLEVRKDLVEMEASTTMLPPMPVTAMLESGDEPEKRIAGEEDVASWEQSEAYARLTLLLARLNKAVKGKSGPSETFSSPVRSICVVSLDLFCSFS